MSPLVGKLSHGVSAFASKVDRAVGGVDGASAGAARIDFVLVDVPVVRARSVRTINTRCDGGIWVSRRALKRNVTRKIFETIELAFRNHDSRHSCRLLNNVAAGETGRRIGCVNDDGATTDRVGSPECDSVVNSRNHRILEITELQRHLSDTFGAEGIPGRAVGVVVASSCRARSIRRNS